MHKVEIVTTRCVGLTVIVVVVRSEVVPKHRIVVACAWQAGRRRRFRYRLHFCVEIERVLATVVVVLARSTESRLRGAKSEDALQVRTRTYSCILVARDRTLSSTRVS